MIRFSFRMPAAGDSRFAPDAFSAQVGKTINIELPHGRATGILLAAEIVDEGRAAVLMLECGEGTARLLQRSNGARRFTPPEDEWPEERATIGGTHQLPGAPGTVEYARAQQERAPDGQADGQCSCGAYRLDGMPPFLHNDGCPNLRTPYGPGEH